MIKLFDFQDVILFSTFVIALLAYLDNRRK